LTNVTPLGSAPVSVRETVGVPVAVIVKLPAVPTVNVVLLALVIAGAVPPPPPFNGTITPNQGVLPPVHVVVAVWIPVAVAAFASETILGETLGATVIPVYPVPGLAVKLQQGTSVTANTRSLAFTVEPLVVIVAVVPPVEFPAWPKLSTSSKQALIGEQDAANDPAFHSLIFNCK
jgi:hypothetical protein